MHDAKLVLNAVVNDCMTYWRDYYEMGVITGAVLAFLYCLILLYRFAHFEIAQRMGFSMPA